MPTSAFTTMSDNRSFSASCSDYDYLYNPVNNIKLFKWFNVVNIEHGKYYEACLSLECLGNTTFDFNNLSNTSIYFRGKNNQGTYENCYAVYGEKRNTYIWMYFNFDNMSTIEALSFNDLQLTSDSMELLVSNSYVRPLNDSEIATKRLEEIQNKNTDRIVGSINKGVDTIVTTGGTYTPNTNTNKLEENVTTLNDLEGQLNTDVDLTQVFSKCDPNTLMADNQDAFKFVKSQFDKIMDFSGFEGVVFFCLTFGLCMFILGKKLKSR